MKTLALYTTLATAALALTSCELAIVPSPYGCAPPPLCRPAFQPGFCGPIGPAFGRPVFQPGFCGAPSPFAMPPLRVRPNGCGYSVWQQPVINFGGGRPGCRRW
jgi:hypothetical protein